MSFVSNSVANVGASLRRSLMDAMLAADMKFLTSQQPGHIANTLVNDVETAAGAYNQAALAVAEMVKIGALLTVSVLISGWILAVALLMAVCSSWLLSILVRLRKRAKAGRFRIAGELLRLTQETFGNIRALKGMNRVDPTRSQIAASINRLMSAVQHGQFVRHTINATQDILMVLALLGGIYICLAVIGISTPELLILAALFILMNNALHQLQALQQNFREMAPAFRSCEALLMEAQSHAERTSGTTQAPLAQGLVFDEVSFAHGERAVLNRASFHIAQGSITVLEGRSGTGKTTVVDLILGFKAPQAGRILVDGVSLQDIALPQWRASIGYVPQEAVLIDGSILDNVTLGDARIGPDEVRHALGMAGLDDFIRDLPAGLATPVGVAGAKLSGGQRQRIALARALVGKPRLLILDEATRALDVRTEQEVCASLARLAPHTTILAITHRPAWTAIADSVIRLGDRAGPAEEGPGGVHAGGLQCLPG